MNSVVQNNSFWKMKILSLLYLLIYFNGKFCALKSTFTFRHVEIELRVLCVVVM